MNKKEFEKLKEYLDKKILIKNAIKEPFNKEEDYLIRLSVAYEDLLEKLDKINEYIDNNVEDYWSECSTFIVWNIQKIINEEE